MSGESKNKLIDIRHQLGFFTSEELQVMFNCGRDVIYNAINSKKLKYISPNGKNRFIKIDEFKQFLINNSK